VIILYPNQRAGFAQYNPYTIDVDQGNRNCYNCREFGHLARNYRNRRMRNRIGKGRRLEYRQKRMIEGRNENINNLNRDQDLILLN